MELSDDNGARDDVFHTHQLVFAIVQASLHAIKRKAVTHANVVPVAEIEVDGVELGQQSAS
ncbi:MAG: hypothetical protein KGO50_18475, partial [Myxococcales bacterium]|nr:hypothetical protein [Myxococcales bacterium]